MNFPYMTAIDEQRTWAAYVNNCAQESTRFFSYIACKAQEIFSVVEAEAIKYYSQIQDKLQEIEVLPIIRDFNLTCTTIEKIFNIASCLLWVSSYSSPLRILFGQALVLAGIALTVFSEGVILASDLNTDKHLIGKWQLLSKFGSELIVHGCLNVCRGTIEYLVNNVTFSLANPALVVPNILFGRNFTPLHVYQNPFDNEAQPASAPNNPIENKGVPKVFPNIGPENVIFNPKTLIASASNQRIKGG